MKLFLVYIFICILKHVSGESCNDIKYECEECFCKNKYFTYVKTNLTDSKNVECKSDIAIHYNLVNCYYNLTETDQNCNFSISKLDLNNEKDESQKNHLILDYLFPYSTLFTYDSYHIGNVNYYLNIPRNYLNNISLAYSLRLKILFNYEIFRGDVSISFIIKKYPNFIIKSQINEKTIYIGSNFKNQKKFLPNIYEKINEDLYENQWFILDKNFQFTDNKVSKSKFSILFKNLDFLLIENSFDTSQFNINVYYVNLELVYDSNKSNLIQFQNEYETFNHKCKCVHKYGDSYCEKCKYGFNLDFSESNDKLNFQCLIPQNNSQYFQLAKIYETSKLFKIDNDSSSFFCNPNVCLKLGLQKEECVNLNEDCNCKAGYLGTNCDECDVDYTKIGTECKKKVLTCFNDVEYNLHKLNSIEIFLKNLNDIKLNDLRVQFNETFHYDEIFNEDLDEILEKENLDSIKEEEKLSFKKPLALEDKKLNNKFKLDLLKFKEQDLIKRIKNCSKELNTEIYKNELKQNLDSTLNQTSFEFNLYFNDTNKKLIDFLIESKTEYKNGSIYFYLNQLFESATFLMLDELNLLTVNLKHIRHNLKKSFEYHNDFYLKILLPQFTFLITDINEIKKKRLLIQSKLVELSNVCKLSNLTSLINNTVNIAEFNFVKEKDLIHFNFFDHIKSSFNHHNYLNQFNYFEFCNHHLESLIYDEKFIDKQICTTSEEIKNLFNKNQDYDLFQNTVSNLFETVIYFVQIFKEYGLEFYLDFNNIIHQTKYYTVVKNDVLEKIDNLTKNRDLNDIKKKFDIYYENLDIINKQLNILEYRAKTLTLTQNLVTRLLNKVVKFTVEFHLLLIDNVIFSEKNGKEYDNSVSKFLNNIIIYKNKADQVYENFSQIQNYTNFMDELSIRNNQLHNKFKLKIANCDDINIDIKKNSQPPQICTRIYTLEKLNNSTSFDISINYSFKDASLQNSSLVYFGPKVLSNDQYFKNKNIQNLSYFVLIQVINRQIQVDYKFGDNIYSLKHSLKIQYRYDLNLEDKWYKIKFSKNENSVKLLVKPIVNDKKQFINEKVQFFIKKEKDSFVKIINSNLIVGELPKPIKEFLKNKNVISNSTENSSSGSINEIKINDKSINLFSFEYSTGFCKPYQLLASNEILFEKIFNFKTSSISYVRFNQIEKYNPNQNLIKFQARTYQNNSILFFNGNSKYNEFLSLTIENGKICFNISSEYYKINLVTNKTYNDNKWFTVYAERKNYFALLIVDDEQVSFTLNHKLVTEKSLNLRLKDEYIYLGGVSNDIDRNYWNLSNIRNLYGFMRSIQIDSILINSNNQYFLNVYNNKKNDPLVQKISFFNDKSHLEFKNVSFANWTKFNFVFETDLLNYFNLKLENDEHDFDISIKLDKGQLILSFVENGFKFDELILSKSDTDEQERNFISLKNQNGLISIKINSYKKKYVFKSPRNNIKLSLEQILYLNLGISKTDLTNDKNKFVDTTKDHRTIQLDKYIFKLWHVDII